MGGYTLYDTLESGNGHKVRLLLGLLDLDYQYVDVNIHLGESRNAQFLEINPNGRIPALKLPDGRTLAESNAILCYLAEGTPYLPEDPFDRARVLSWLFWEQYEHEPTIAVARFWVHHHEMTESKRAQLAEKQEKGHKALQLMEKNFTYADWAVGTEPTVADIALYSYTCVAEEGEISLAPYPSIRTWLNRVEALPGFVPMADFNTLAIAQK